jgi:hypothetical protein
MGRSHQIREVLILAVASIVVILISVGLSP